MRRRIGMMLAAILALACLVGCSEGGLSDRDFMIYDENGNVTKKMEDTAEGYHIMATKEGEYTSRKIGVGSTEEELKEAYGDIWDEAKVIEPIGSSPWRTYRWVINEKYMFRVYVDQERKEVRGFSMDLKKRLDEEIEKDS